MKAEFFQPSLEEKKLMYSFYLLTFDSSFGLAKKRHIMGSVLAHEKWGWRVVGITKKAILKIAENNYRLPNGLQRDHFKRSRSETFNELFECKYDISGWWNLIWDGDETILMTKEEHDKHKELDNRDVIEVDYRLGYFVNSYVGIKFGRHKEGVFVKCLYEAINSGED